MRPAAPEAVSLRGGVFRASDRARVARLLHARPLVAPRRAEPVRHAERRGRWERGCGRGVGRGLDGTGLAVDR